MADIEGTRGRRLKNWMAKAVNCKRCLKLMGRRGK